MTLENYIPLAHLANVWSKHINENLYLAIISTNYTRDITGNNVKAYGVLFDSHLLLFYINEL